MRKFNYIKAGLLLSAVLCTLLNGCNNSKSHKILKNLNVALIIVDTLPAHAIGVYGSDTKTPNIDAFAKAGVQFNNAFSAAPWTKPAISSILTGYLPRTHGSRRLNHSISPKVQTLAEYYKSKGRQTAAIVSHIALSPKYGFARGFDTFHNVNPVHPHKTITGQLVTDKAIEWLNTHNSNFFLMLHYFDPHFNYLHHEEFDRTSSYKGDLKSASDIRNLIRMIPKLKKDDINFLRGLFSEEVSYTDKQLGRFFDYLKEQGLDKNTLVILVADHGEEIMERGWIGHTKHLYNELIHVPLIFSLPDVFEPHTVNDNVASYDIFQTAVDLTERKDSAKGDGKSLIPYLMKKKGKDRNRIIISEVDYVSSNKVQDANKVSIVQGKYKIIHDIPSGRFALYDLSLDPTEKKDISKQYPEIVKTLAEHIFKYEELSSDEGTQEVKISDKEIEQLKSLGYID